MTVFPSARLRTTLVGRLRAAGCVFAEDEAALLLSTAGSPAELAAMVDRRAAGLPLELVLGWAEFCGLRIAVEPGVFVPRRRTEFLAEQAVALGRPGAVVLDLCCGAGALGAAVATALGRVELHAADLQSAACGCARRNLGPLGGEVHQGDLYEALPAHLRGRIDLLVANAPYVPTDRIRLLPPEAREHEPVLTLDGGADGLAVQRRVIAGARDWLAPGGHLLIETGAHQAADTAAAFTAHGLTPRIVNCPDREATVVIGS
ncbi:methylase [Kitasatospora sp. MMS16-BH015]|uniref:putative protein N(5)-glutamine methyltransferase n=1 Tax=Kitasatospora sp. MMS16-BH015 TaxID=2018025 RepID=UPI000CA392DF|nr:putative protein N(5)-glutamine methyltransferase [Kitasatospora sp. MMS16-BH015]AUG76335.1 methylase [Kitasatospora sp. MMS16-BH015]